MNEKEKFLKDYFPINKNITKNYEKYYNKSLPNCALLDTNEIRRIFTHYDKTKMGLIRKSDLQFLFYDIKNELSKANFEINEKKFIDNMLDFYSKASETCSIEDVKISFNKICYDNSSNAINKNKLLPDLEYIKMIAFDKDNESKKEIKSEKLGKISRNDIFNIKCITYKAPKTVVLNENKLAIMYK